MLHCVRQSAAVTILQPLIDPVCSGDRLSLLSWPVKAVELARCNAWREYGAQRLCHRAATCPAASVPYKDKVQLERAEQLVQAHRQITLCAGPGSPAWRGACARVHASSTRRRSPPKAASTLQPCWVLSLRVLQVAAGAHSPSWRDLELPPWGAVGVVRPGIVCLAPCRVRSTRLLKLSCAQPAAGPSSTCQVPQGRREGAQHSPRPGQRAGVLHRQGGLLHCSEQLS